jgi:flagellar motor switch protein FliM
MSDPIESEPASNGVDGEAPPRAGPAAGEPLLRQEDVDRLLGLGGTARPGRPARGIMAVLTPGDVTYERLPMLEVVFDRLERILTSSVRNVCSQGVEIGLASVGAQRFGDYLEALPLPAMIAVVRAVEWDGHILVTVDQQLIYAIVDVLLGARAAAGGAGTASRPFTSIETSLVERVVKLALADLALAFQPLAAVQLRLERIETNPRFTAITRASSACSLFKLAVHFEDRGGTLEVLLPHATLEPIRMLLLQQFMGEKFGRDPIWETHLAGAVWHTSIEVEAVLEEQTLPLGAVMALEVGAVLKLDADVDAPIELRCGAVPLLRGRLGRVGDRLAVAVDGVPPPHEETGHG